MLSYEEIQELYAEQAEEKQQAAEKESKSLADNSIVKTGR